MKYLVVYCLIFWSLFSKGQSVSWDLKNIDTLLSLSHKYYDKGDLDSAFYFNQLALENNKEDYNLFKIYTNMGIIFEDQELFFKSITYYKRSLKVSTNLIDSMKSYNNIGTSYSYLEEYELSNIYYNKSLDIEIILNDTIGIAVSYQNLGVNKYYLNELDSALYYHYLARDIVSNNPKVLVEVYCNLASMIDNFKISEKYVDSIIDLANQLGNPTFLLKAYEIRYSNLISIKKYKEAIDINAKLDELEDSIKNIEMTKHMTELETKYQAQEKESQIKVLEKDKQLQEKEIKYQNKVNFLIFLSLIFLLIILVVGSVFYFKMIKSKKIIESQNTEISKQNIEISLKNEEINDSIDYAQRLQSAMLNSSKKNLKYTNEFIFFQPKDRVSGDFYWTHQNEDLKFFCVSDCTGHGVPGAFLSVVGNNALNSIVENGKVLEPSKILEALNIRVFNTFKNEDFEVKDGMDITICNVNKENLMRFSGANNPIYILRKHEFGKIESHKQIQSNEKHGLYKIPGDRRHIGTSDNSKFKQWEVQLYKGDEVFLFSDGYADQFGGEKDKKFRYKNFQLLLMENISMADKSEMLKEKINSWKGVREQTDDISVLGFQI